MAQAHGKLKVVMLGDFAVGKTSLVNRYVHSIFSEKYLATLGVHISKKDIVLDGGGQGRDVTFLLWDINGEDGFHTVLPQYLKGAAGAILVCDATRPGTWSSIAGHEKLFRRENPEGTCVVALNKIDLLTATDARAAEKELGRRSGAGGSLLYPTSAKAETNVNALFAGLGALCLGMAVDD
jgi:small GTP-binding protein